MLLLDTNVVSELRKGTRCDARVSCWYRDVDDSSIHLSVVTLGEIRRGIESIRRRDPDSGLALEAWLLRLVRAHADRILPIDAGIAEAWGRLNVPDPMPVLDGLLAATALVHGLTLVTRNVRHVERAGLRVVDPFAGT